jgi:D-arabinose 1-dehydrogenase-like Zn-dependent alcohol dehydrogenase
MSTTYAYAATDATAPLAPFEIQRRELRANDVQMEVLFCGVCHSDLHQARNEWKNTVFPVVPGHEIVGRVTAVGADVTKFKAGDLVGVGCLVDSCRTCTSCQEDLEQYCENGFVGTYNGLTVRSRMAAIPRNSSSTKRSRCGYRRISTRRVLRRCCARALPRIRRCARGAPVLARRLGLSGWVGLAIWA